MTNWKKRLVSKKIEAMEKAKPTIFQKICSSIPIILDIPEASNVDYNPPKNYSFRNDMICCGFLLITVNYIILTYLPHS
jgi:hypothetical protein